MSARREPRAPGGIRVCTVMLAAGRSSRMGATHKLLEVVEGRSVLAWSLDAPIEADLGPVIVVTGHRAEEVEALLPSGVTPVRNPEWPEGMASSLRIGVATLPETTDAVAISLGDMPAVRASHFRALATAWSSERILVPTHLGQRGHPVFWPWSLVHEFAELRGDTGARPIMARHSHLVDEVPFDDAGVVLDVDREADLPRVREALRRRSGAS